MNEIHIEVKQSLLLIVLQISLLSSRRKEFLLLKSTD